MAVKAGFYLVFGVLRQAAKTVGFNLRWAVGVGAALNKI